MGESAAKIDLILELSKTELSVRPKRAFDFHGRHYLKESLLGVFDYCPTDLVKDGFDEKLLEQLDVGFDRQEMRITFPIRDLYGNLIGISGRTVTNAYPRYKVYKSHDLMRFSSGDFEDNERYKAYDIKNHEFLWNMHNVFPSLFYGQLDTLIIVEGYKACIWMLQNGFTNTVALQGSRMSSAQEETICQFDGNVFLLLDNNSAGKKGAADTGKRLVCRGQKVYVCAYPDYVEDTAQPDNLNKDELTAILDTAKTFVKWRKTCPEIPRSVGSRWDSKFTDT
jgi:DNA primase